MYSFILLIALFTVLGSGYDIRKLSVEAPEQSYDGSIDQGQNTDTGGLVWDSGRPYYGKPTDCTWSGGRMVGSCDCPNQQSKFVISTPDPEIGYAICAAECTTASDCPPAPHTASVSVKCILGRCLLDCSGTFEYCLDEDFSFCVDYQMAWKEGTMCQWRLPRTYQ
ncbi:hypothetical protein Pmar_PMAR012955 [Perkinsus marinus ATCC 50983]|uniref:Uncharacterized protein n=1 Tax=Perkinsus marinus (strain ATCC 50983 / TXsc) TaxID=423536 RepID=C5L1Q3_PERM5|nr:hypothetical protein Pmar_PMAR012955 [Perkinsus marinus ATCC 50983]EER09340.1 hypothetical protein Pmar_PMAR012955 [Perkinsus marinus ATCC 50983]|eukprot:XP_002777524.1 hypothetical protein Pmar_PMAR012955 [Perkinsus marinus ATCC 50983]